MGSNLFTSSLSGMNAAQYGLTTTQHNISNANTPGFTRQETVVSSRPGSQFGGGFIGQGVDVTGVKRIYDQFLSTQVLQEQSQATYLTTYYTALKQIDNLVADPTAGAAPAMRDFFAATNGVSNSPESIPARQTMLSNAQFAVNRFQAIDQRLTDIANGLSAQLTSSVDLVNSYSKQIAALNGSIKRAVATGNGQQPNDLLDQRDQLITKLNQEVKTTTLKQADGTMNVFIGTGQTLVVDEQAMSLRVVRSATDPSKVDVAYQNNNSSVVMQQSSLQGGNLGAFLGFRDQTLEPMRNELGRVALSLAMSVNQQNQAGLDLRGQPGKALFNAAAPRVDMGGLNQGTATVTASIANLAAITTSDYQLKVNGGGSYTMVRLSDNFVTNITPPAVMPQTIDGISVDISAGAIAGDSFLIRPTANAARDLAVMTNDPASIAAAAPIRGNATLTNLGTGVIGAGSVNMPLPLDPNLQAPVTITFNAGNTYTVSGTLSLPAVSPVTLPYTPGTPINLSYNGWTTQITGTPSTNDTFTVSANTNATGDSRNALLMANFQTTGVLDGGTTGIQAAYSQLVGRVGAKTNEFAVTSVAQTNMVAETIKQQQSTSGVNLDEEAANLLRFQRAYEASAKALQVSNTMFDALLALGK
ncbi:MAG TPA: flagellar hook-associated protein FlgK [Gallionella sp.]|nr:flagellar hook-associated protein FlgK [Gallionella sp.]